MHLAWSKTNKICPFQESIAKLAIKMRQSAIITYGKECDKIIIPFSKEQLDLLFQTDCLMHTLLLGFLGQLDNHYPSDKLLQTL